MNYIKGTFTPEGDPENAERRTLLDGQEIIIYRPKSKITGLTFVLTAANLPLAKYASIVDALNSANHVVVGIYISVLNPLTLRYVFVLSFISFTLYRTSSYHVIRELSRFQLSRNNLHRMKAERIPPMFHELRDEFKVNKYDIVGHSIGGKIALLTAALYDDENLIRNVLALDPVDQTPPEFTNESALKQTNSNQKGRSNVSLGQSKADIVITCTDSGVFVSKAHNGREIQRLNPSTKLVLHRNTHHMVYTDEGGQLSWKALMGNGTSQDRNQVVKEQTLQLIKDRANSSLGSGVTKGVTGIKGKVMKGISDAGNDLKELGTDAEKKVNKLKGAAMFGKFMG